MLHVYVNTHLLHVSFGVLHHASIIVIGLYVNVLDTYRLQIGMLYPLSHAQA